MSERWSLMMAKSWDESLNQDSRSLLHVAGIIRKTFFQGDVERMRECDIAAAQ